MVISYRRFGTTYRSHLQGSGINSTLRKIPEGRSAALSEVTHSPSRLLSHQERAVRRLLTDSAGNELMFEFEFVQALKGATFCNGLRGSSATDCSSVPFCCTKCCVFGFLTAVLQEHTVTATVHTLELQV
jgi:hypothetical protein